MTLKYPPINAKFPRFLHGGDYNPDQWHATPHIWDDDMRLMKLAHCNTMSVGIFSWVNLEPEEGHFEFDWLDRVMDLLIQNDAYAVLATPSGARPAWMSAQYPEVLRVRSDRRRNLHGLRHNHCMTSPIYREKVRIINAKLAERYQDHPALLVWHISNEYNGECHCDLCQAAFRAWLQRKYGTLDALNHAWWTSFWSHTYTDWSQLESPSPLGETRVHGLNLDWNRFVTDQTVNFMQHEILPLREFTPEVPVTTNLMGTYMQINYWKIAPEIDVISWDSYPAWHQKQPDSQLGAAISFVHDINRSMKGGQPFMLMESTPSMTNWMSIAKLKRPGMHMLSSLQAVAHGSDTVQYFQWRKSRGSCEKLHGAVVDHAGHENTRVFRDVAAVGQALEQLDDVIGSTVRAEVAIIFDWENYWALTDAEGPRSGEKGYEETCQQHYQAFWQRGISVDVNDMEQDFSRYKLVIAPMLYMVRPGVAERIETFVQQGGIFVATYLTGMVDENDLCFLGGFPGPLRQVLGIWAEEIDALTAADVNYVTPVNGNALGLTGKYEATRYCSLIHAERASTLATYQADFYAGRPALTVNAFGAGQAYYIASHNDGAFLADFYRKITDEAQIIPVLATELPAGVTVQARTDGARDFVFIMNFTPEEQTVALDTGSYTDMLAGDKASSAVTLAPYGIRILARAARH